MNWGIAMVNKTENHSELDLLFQEARDTSIEPSPDLLARVLDDGLAHMPVAAMDAGPVVRLPGWRRLLSALGGWPAAAGLVTAAVTGVSIGYAAPGPVGTVTSGFGLEIGTGYDVVDLIPSLDGIYAEVEG